MKLPAFQFYPGDWRKDPNLSRCSKAAKGVWIDMLVLMFECPIRGVLADAGGKPWSDQEIAEAIGGPTASNLECIAELLGKGVARRDNRGAIFSRRLVRDEATRQATNGRVKKHRSNANVTQDVTPMKHDSSSSTSSSKPPPYPPPGENGGPAALSAANCDIDAWQAGQALSELLGLGGSHKALARDACAAVKRRKPDLRFTETPEFVRSLWREYDSMAVHAKVSLKTFLGEIGRFMDSDSWKTSASHSSPVLDEYGGHFEGTVYVTAAGKRMPGYIPPPKGRSN